MAQRPRGCQRKIRQLKIEHGCELAWFVDFLRYQEKREQRCMLFSTVKVCWCLPRWVRSGGDGSGGHHGDHAVAVDIAHWSPLRMDTCAGSSLGDADVMYVQDISRRFILFKFGSCTPCQPQRKYTRIDGPCPPCPCPLITEPLCKAWWLRSYCMPLADGSFVFGFGSVCGVNMALFEEFLHCLEKR